MAKLLRLADEFWLSAHDQLGGSCALKDRPFGVGLGTALLCELVKGRHIVLANLSETGFENWQLFLTDVPWPADDTLYELLFMMCDEVQRLPRHGPLGQSISEWIAFLAGDGPDRARALMEGVFDDGRYAPARRVGDRAIEKGRLTRGVPPVAVPVIRWKMSGRTAVHVPGQATDACWASAGIATALRQRRALDEQSLLLTELYSLTQLDRIVLQTLDPDDVAFLKDQQSSIPADYRTLIDHADAVLGNTVMTG